MIAPIPALAIVDESYDVEETTQPFGKRWGGEVMTLTKEHLAALQEGKLVAVDVMAEYVVFLRLQNVSLKPNTDMSINAE